MKLPLTRLHDYTTPDLPARDLATRINEVMADPVKRGRMGKAGRKRAEELFSWEAIAKQVVTLYGKL